MRGHNKTFILILSILLLIVVPVDAITPSPGRALTLKTKGDACYKAGRYDEAMAYYSEGQEKAREEDDDDLYYACMGNIANIYSVTGDYQRALHYYLQCYHAAQKNGNIELQWVNASNIVGAYCMAGDAKRARAYFHLQMQIPVKDLTRKRYYFLNNQAYIAMAGKQFSLADYYHKALLKYVRDKRLPVMYEVAEYIELGKIRLMTGKPREAAGYLIQARDSMMKQDNKDQLVTAYELLSKAYGKLGMNDSAEFYRNRYLALSDSIFNKAQFNVAGNKLFNFENRESRRQIDSLTMRNVVLLVTAAVFLVMVIALTLFYIALRRKNKSLVQAQRMLIAKNEELVKSERQSKRFLEQYVESIDGTQASPAGIASPAKDDAAAADAGQAERNDIGLDKQQQSRLLNRITTILDDVEVISQPDFSLASLADRAGSNIKYVSWVINEAYGKNFKTLLNERRIREACRRLSDSEHYGNVTIQAIYEGVGFNYAASFIQAFKKVTGMTPSVYQRLEKRKD